MVHRVIGIKKAIDDASNAVTAGVALSVVAVVLGIIAIAISAYALTRS
jgi:succinate dehydrogenase hydrophobic anchor subunit